MKDNFLLVPVCSRREGEKKEEEKKERKKERKNRRKEKWNNVKGREKVH